MNFSSVVVSKIPDHIYRLVRAQEAKNKKNISKPWAKLFGGLCLSSTFDCFAAWVVVGFLPRKDV